MLGVGSIRCVFFFCYGDIQGSLRPLPATSNASNFCKQKEKKTSTLSIGHRLDLVQMLGVTRVISSQIITQSLITIFLF